MRFVGQFCVVLLTLFEMNEAVTQCSNSHFGVGDPNSKDDHIDSNNGFGYRIAEVDYIIDCCGIVDQWEADLEVSGSQTIYYQVWRQQSGNTWELVGENSYTTSSDGEQSTSIATTQQITIKPNDQFGWWSSGSDMVRYKDGGGEKDDTLYMSMADPAVGDTRDWTSATNDNDRTYAIKMSVNSNSSPTFSNLDNTVSVANTDSSGSTIFTVTATDINTYDISSLTVTMATNSKFSFDTSSKEVRISSSLLGSSATTELLVFTVTDQCTLSSIATLTVTITNTAPVINNLPDSTSISESETAATFLFTVTVTDVGDTVTCGITSPASPPFELRVSDNGIYSKSNPGFDYDAQSSYTLTITCTDQSGDSDTGYYTVSLIRNSSPVFVNLQNDTSVSTSTSVSTNVFTVISTDAEGDQLYYNMTCDPTPCPFEIFDSGAIQLNSSLTSHTTVGYDLYIYVYDGRTLVGPGLLTITISGINDPVVINNLPLGSALSILENSALSASVYYVSVTDTDTSDTHVFTMTSSPGSGLTYFSIDTSTGQITTSSSTNINYEVLSTTSFDFTVTVSDGSTTDTEILQIEISDVNEAPSFNKALYSISTTEGVAGAALPDPSFVVTDPDSGDTKFFTFDCGSDTGYFTMATSDGTLTFASDYDLDGGSRPSSVSCTVTVRDSGGLTDICTLSISIADTNDNTPVFSPTSYSFFASYYASTGTTIGTVTATDADSGANGVITYTLDQSSLSTAYFGINSNGDIYTQVSVSPLGVGTTVTITAIASDIGGSSDNATVVIVISDSTTTVSTTTTISYKTFTEDGASMAWIVACAVVVICILLFSVWFFCISDGARQMCRVLKARAKRRRILKERRRYNRRRYRRQVSPPDSPRSRDNMVERLDLRNLQNESVRNAPPPPGNQRWRSRV